MARPLKLFLLLVVALALIGALAFGLLFLVSGGQPVDYIQTALIRLSLQSRQAALDQPLSADTTPVRFVVNSGDPPRLIAANLYEAGLIADADLFVDYVRAYDIDVELEAGTYFLKRAQSIREIAAALTDSSHSQIVFSIIEGWRMEEVAEAVDSNPLFAFSGEDFLRVVGAGAEVHPTFAQFVGLPSGASLEGFLFPDTYSLPPEETPEMLRAALLDQFSAAVNAAGIPADAVRQDMTLYEIVTLASIVQREAVHLDEAPQIAGVYWNRLNIGMKLDADPTVQYPLGHPGDWWVRITQADYGDTISSYNTYLSVGLPPGPIANPGIKAMRAAANPAASEYLYFQADCSGSGYHRFALTLAEHVANSCS